jgi:hypothetical protein
MRLRLLTLSAATALAALVIGGPALAQSGGAGASGGSSSSAGGSSVSTGNSSSSASVNTGGGANVGVIQGNVAEGSSGSTSSNGAGDQTGSANSGSAGSGQTVGAADAPNAATEGVLRRLELPAIGTTTNATPVSDSGPGLTMWGLAAAVVLGLALLYRRLPRPSSA